MLAKYNEMKLEKLLEEFINIYTIRNNITTVVTYEDILLCISSFSMLPTWPATIFVNTKQCSQAAPYYITVRQDSLSLEDEFSNYLIYDKVINCHYKVFQEQHPKAFYFCNKLIKLILIAKLSSYIEGTTADNLGIAHLDFKPAYNQFDFNELIIHQIVHTLLYINDYLQPQIEDKYKTLLVATNGKHKRGGSHFPLYVLFHSFCVGVEILQHRIASNTLNSKVNYHSSTASIINRCKTGLTILNKNSQYFTSKGYSILNSYGEMLDNLVVRIKNDE